MAEEFGQQTSPVAALKSILGNYPYSVGLLREILQNSDDARASRQVREELAAVSFANRYPRFLFWTEEHIQKSHFTMQA